MLVRVVFGYLGFWGGAVGHIAPVSVLTRFTIFRPLTSSPSAPYCALRAPYTVKNECYPNTSFGVVLALVACYVNTVLINNYIHNEYMIFRLIQQYSLSTHNAKIVFTFVTFKQVGRRKKKITHRDRFRTLVSYMLVSDCTEK